MGATQSSEGGRYGLHVLMVENGSPAEDAGLEPIFDWIIGVNNVRINAKNDSDVEAFTTIVANHLNQSLLLEVYSSKDQGARDVSVVPSNTWPQAVKSGSTGNKTETHIDNASNTTPATAPTLTSINDTADLPSPPQKTSLLGVTLRSCNYTQSGRNIWHVLSIQPGSPAERAGLIPDSDYIIGTPDAHLNAQEDFYDLVEDFIGRKLRLYVYNSEFEACREIEIMPLEGWGGSGLLGCELGYGLLHRLPSSRLRDPSTIRRISLDSIDAEENSPSAAAARTENGGTVFDVNEFEGGDEFFMSDHGYFRGIGTRGSRRPTAENITGESTIIQSTVPAIVQVEEASEKEKNVAKKEVIDGVPPSLFETTG